MSTECHMNKKLYTFTFVVLVISMLLSLFFFVISIVLAVNRAIPLFLFLLAVVFCFVALSKHYCSCLTHLKQGAVLDHAKRKRICAANVIVMVSAMITCISMTLILLYTFAMLRIMLAFQIYFLAVDMVAILYFANAVWMDKWMRASAKNAG